MSTITKERIELFIKNPLENGLTRGEQMELARIALASLEAEPVSQTYKFPVNTPCQDAPAHIWLQTAGVWPEDGELSELTWCSHNQHHDDTLFVRADLVNGNYPVTPDGWISCSERMPDKLIPVIVMYEDGEMWSAMWNGNRWDDGTEYPDPHSVTHWSEMPAAPQQEVNRG
ncbi:DUF551 domain-containing protein [Escherichia coli]|nr:DUF551 domain-containing protein [Escherichia coli]